jgi:hypothetical protein
MAFETFLKQRAVEPRLRRWRGITYTLSLSLHASLLAVMLVRSYWVVDELQPRGAQVTLHMVFVPPPPPAAPEPAKPNVEAKPKVVAAQRPRVEPVPSPSELVQPTPAPKEEEPPSAEAPAAVDEGGGVAGGVVGGVAGLEVAPAIVAAPIAAVVPQPDPTPIMLSPNVGVGQRLSDISEPRFRPQLPPSLTAIGAVVWGLFRICVTNGGRVKNVDVLKSADPLVDDAWIEVIRRWEYRPYSVAGRPVPFCHATRIEVRTVH